MSPSFLSAHETVRERLPDKEERSLLPWRKKSRVPKFFKIFFCLRFGSSPQHGANKVKKKFRAFVFDLPRSHHALGPQKDVDRAALMGQIRIPFFQEFPK